MKTCWISLKWMSILTIAIAITLSLVPVAEADGSRAPLANGPQSGAVAGSSSPGDGTSAVVSFEYFPNGGIRRIQMQCSQGTTPHVDSEGGVIRQSCQPVADKPIQPTPSQ
jgi:hypothetical protein